MNSITGYKIAANLGVVALTGGAVTDNPAVMIIGGAVAAFDFWQIARLNKQRQPTREELVTRCHGLRTCISRQLIELCKVQAQINRMDGNPRATVRSGKERRRNHVHQH